MRASATRYGVILLLQLLLLSFDFCCNCFVCISKQNSGLLLFLFMYGAVLTNTLILIIRLVKTYHPTCVYFRAQDVCLVLALIILMVTFIGTYVFQAGLIEILYDKFKATIIVSFTYLIVTVSCHVWWLILHYENSEEYNWTSTFVAIYILQGMLAPVYYHFYRRTALRMSDPRFYEPLEWISCRGPQ